MKHSGWRPRRRNVSGGPEDESSDDYSAEVIMNTLTLAEAPRNARFAPRRAKRMKLVDLEAMTGGGASGDQADSSSQSMFAEPILAIDEASDERDALAQCHGTGLLCFISAESFVGVLEVDHGGHSQTLRLHGTETLAECNRELCGASDCCGEKAYILTVQGAQLHSKRSFTARSVGVGDYVVLEGQGFRFHTQLVPAEAQREQILQRNFSTLPPSVREDAVLCMGLFTMAWQDGGSPPPPVAAGSPVPGSTERPNFPSHSLPSATTGRWRTNSSDANAHRRRDVLEEQEGYAGDKSSDASSTDELERSVRSILPMLAQVTMPTPDAATFGFDELLARGGRPMSPRSAIAADLEDDWLS